MRGEARQATIMIDGLPLQTQPRRAIEHRACPDRADICFAEVGLATKAIEAFAAIGSPAQHDMIADAKIGDSRTDRFDDTGSLMPGNHRHRMLRCAGDEVIIAVTHPRRRDAHEHFARARLLQIQLVNLKRRARFPQNRGGHFHGLPNIFRVARIVGSNVSSSSGCAFPHVVLR